MSQLLSQISLKNKIVLFQIKNKKILYEFLQLSSSSSTSSDEVRGELKLGLIYDANAGILTVKLIEVVISTCYITYRIFTLTFSNGWIGTIIFVRVSKAHDLRARELSGIADPYAKIRLLPDRSNVWQTTIHRRTLNPGKNFPSSIRLLRNQTIHWNIKISCIFLALFSSIRWRLCFRSSTCIITGRENLGNSALRFWCIYEAPWFGLRAASPIFCAGYWNKFNYYYKTNFAIRSGRWF